MNAPTEQILKEFVNALQLSIKTKIVGASYADGDVFIKFGSRAKPDDTNLHKFLNSFEVKWTNGRKEVRLSGVDDINWPKVILFLLLTRMNEQNIRSLSEDDPYFADIAKNAGMKNTDSNIDSVKRCSKRIFEKIKEKKFTIRALAERTNLSQVSILNFKAGNDIKLSNLLKLTKALGLQLKIK